MATITEIFFDLANAVAIKRSLTMSLDSYCSVGFASLAYVSDGTPPKNHDECVSAINTALNGYREALTRDGEAITEIANALIDTDATLANLISGGS